MTDIVNWRFLLVLVIVLPCLAVQAHYFPKHGPLRHPRHGHEHGHKHGHPGRSLLMQEDGPMHYDKHGHDHWHKHGHKHGHPGRSLLMQEDGPMHYDKHGHDHWHKHGHKHGHPGRSLLMPEDGPMDYHKHGRDHWHKHGHKHKHGRPHGSGRSLLMQEDGSMDNDKHEHDEHEHHHDHKHDHDHDHKHHPKHLLLFAHEIKKNISEVQRGNKSKEEEFDRIRTVSAVLKEGKHNESKIVGSQVGIVVLGKEHFYTSFSYFLHGHGTIAVQGFVHGGKAKEAFLAVVGGTGEFFSVTGVDRAIFHHDKGVDVIIHHLTLDYPKHRA